MIKRLKEPFCSLSHALGVLLSVVALVVLLVQSSGKPLHMLAFAVYGITLITLYLASTLYHSLHAKPSTVQKLARFDYCAIYLLIAGSYTPVCLVALSGPWGWGLLSAVWGFVLAGIAGCLFWRNNPDWLRMTLYLLMGWMVIVAFAPLRSALPTPALQWLLAGGIAYSVGAVVLAIDRPHLWPGKFSAHDLWHLFVLAGSVCHFVLMSGFIAPLHL